MSKGKGYTHFGTSILASTYAMCKDAGFVYEAYTEKLQMNPLTECTGCFRIDVGSGDFLVSGIASYNVLETRASKHSQ